MQGVIFQIFSYFSKVSSSLVKVEQITKLKIENQAWQATSLARNQKY